MYIRNMNPRKYKESFKKIEDSHGQNTLVKHIYC